MSAINPISDPRVSEYMTYLHTHDAQATGEPATVLAVFNKYPGYNPTALAGEVLDAIASAGSPEEAGTIAQSYLQAKLDAPVSGVATRDDLLSQLDSHLSQSFAIIKLLLGKSDKPGAAVPEGTGFGGDAGAGVKKLKKS